jgi:hypothetical protein
MRDSFAASVCRRTGRPSSVMRSRSPSFAPERRHFAVDLAAVLRESSAPLRGASRCPPPTELSACARRARSLRGGGFADGTSGLRGGRAASNRVVLGTAGDQALRTRMLLGIRAARHHPRPSASLNGIEAAPLDRRAGFRLGRPPCLRRACGSAPGNDSCTRSPPAPSAAPASANRRASSS